MKSKKLFKLLASKFYSNELSNNNNKYVCEMNEWKVESLYVYCDKMWDRDNLSQKKC